MLPELITPVALLVKGKKSAPCGFTILWWQHCIWLPSESCPRRNGGNRCVFGTYMAPKFKIEKISYLGNQVNCSNISKLSWWR